MRRTKIICTLGPATSNLERIRELVRAGIDRAAELFSRDCGRPYAVCAVGAPSRAGGGTAGSFVAGSRRPEDSHRPSPRWETCLAAPGSNALAHSRRHRGIKPPGFHQLSPPRTMLARHKAQIPVLAKLETPEAVEHLDSILAVSDGVMVARGDLGVEMSPEKVPLIQKKIIQQAAAARVPVITATQMLESMTVNLRPTRAEASDVANAIFDGTDALMLSGETASGQHPIEALRMMVRIAEQMDRSRQERYFRRDKRPLDIAETICESVVHATQMLGIRAIVAFTRSGSTARLISKYRPPRPVYAFCHKASIARRASLYWGVSPFVMPLTLDTEATLAQAEALLLRRKLFSRGDILAVVAGSPGKPGQTNLMKLIRVAAA